MREKERERERERGRKREKERERGRKREKGEGRERKGEGDLQRIENCQLVKARVLSCTLYKRHSRKSVEKRTVPLFIIKS